MGPSYTFSQQRPLLQDNMEPPKLQLDIDRDLNDESRGFGIDYCILNQSLVYLYSGARRRTVSAAVQAAKSQSKEAGRHSIGPQPYKPEP